MVAVAYRRWSFTRGSNCKALTKKVLVFWIGGPYRRWSHMEVPLYLNSYLALRLGVNRTKESILQVDFNIQKMVNIQHLQREE